MSKYVKNAPPIFFRVATNILSCRVLIETETGIAPRENLSHVDIGANRSSSDISLFTKNLSGCQFFWTFWFSYKKKIVMMINNKIKKLEVGQNDPELFKLPSFPTFQLFGAFLGLYNPNKLHNFFVKSLMRLDRGPIIFSGGRRNCKFEL
jgi:hypothetical protein